MKRSWCDGKPRKKLEYCSETITQNLLNTAEEMYKKRGILSSITVEFIEEYRLNPMRVRKLLITAGVYESEMAKQVRDLHENGKSWRRL